MRTAYDAIVIGAGVAGGTMAARLSQLGFDVALVERQAFPRRKVCGECIAATNLPLLDALGLGDAFAALAGPPLERVALYAGDAVLETALPAAGQPRHPYGRALGRERLDTLLAERAAALGAAVWQPWTVTAIGGAPGAYAAHLRAASGAEIELHAPVLVDAHGSWERPPVAAEARRAGAAARRRPQLPSAKTLCSPRGRARDLFAFKATFAKADLPPGLLPVLALPGGYGGMVVADGGLLTLACCIRRDALARCRGAVRGERAGDAVERWLRTSCLGVRRALRRAERAGRWLAVGPIRPGRRPLWSERRGFAIGNAGGEAHPLLGEGISMALQSAWLLAAMLDAHRAPLLEDENARASHAALAREYASLWRRRFAGRVRFAALCAELAMRPRASGLLLPALRRRPALLAEAARLGGKVRGLASSEPATPSLTRCEGPT